MARERSSSDSGSLHSSCEDTDDADDSLCGSKIADRFSIQAAIGEGTFGKVYEAIDEHTNEQVAVKFSLKGRYSSLLYLEYRVYSILAREERDKRFPAFYHWGKFGSQDVLVIKKLGPDIEKWTEGENRLPFRLVCKLGHNLLHCLEDLHACGIVHQDIAPDNILADSHQPERFYLMDFGLSSFFLDRDTKKHYPQTSVSGYLGMALYASKTAHYCLQQSAKDDVEALGYIILELIIGELPWHFVVGDSDTLWERIGAMKLGLTNRQLCRGAPQEMVSYFDQVKLLRYDERPDYESLRQLIARMDEHYAEYMKKDE